VLGRDSFFFSVLPFRYGPQRVSEAAKFQAIAGSGLDWCLILDDGGAVCESQTWPARFFPASGLSPFP